MSYWCHFGTTLIAERIVPRTEYPVPRTAPLERLPEASERLPAARGPRMACGDALLLGGGHEGMSAYRFASVESRTAARGTLAECLEPRTYAHGHRHGMT